MNKIEKLKSVTISSLVSALLTAAAALTAYLLIANIGSLTRDLISSEAVSGALDQLKSAAISPFLPLQIGYFGVSTLLLSFILFYKKRRVLACLLSALLFLLITAGNIALVRVNGVPFHTALKVIISILNSGII